MSSFQKVQHLLEMKSLRGETLSLLRFLAKPQSVISRQVFWFWQHLMFCEQKIVTIPEYRWMVFCYHRHTPYSWKLSDLFFSSFLHLLNVTQQMGYYTMLYYALFILFFLTSQPCLCNYSRHFQKNRKSSLLHLAANVNPRCEQAV